MKTFSFDFLSQYPLDWPNALVPPIVYEYSLRDVADIKWLVRPRRDCASDKPARSLGDPFGDDPARQIDFLNYLWSEGFTWGDPEARAKLQKHFSHFNRAKKRCRAPDAPQERAMSSMARA